MSKPNGWAKWAAIGTVVMLAIGVSAMFARPLSRVSAVEANVESLRAADVRQEQNLMKIDVEVREMTKVLMEIKGVLIARSKGDGT